MTRLMLRVRPRELVSGTGVRFATVGHPHSHRPGITGIFSKADSSCAGSFAGREAAQGRVSAGRTGIPFRGGPGVSYGAYVPVRDIGFDLGGRGLGAKPHPRPQPKCAATALQNPTLTAAVRNYPTDPKRRKPRKSGAYVAGWPRKAMRADLSN